MKKEIGTTLNVKATIVDYNDGYKMAKVCVKGFGEDKSRHVERYLWVSYEDIDKIN